MFQRTARAWLFSMVRRKSCPLWLDKFCPLWSSKAAPARSDYQTPPSYIVLIAK